jgi:hypothetical protein
LIPWGRLNKHLEGAVKTTDVFGTVDCLFMPLPLLWPRSLLICRWSRSCQGKGRHHRIFGSGLWERGRSIATCPPRRGRPDVSIEPREMGDLVGSIGSRGLVSVRRRLKCVHGGARAPRRGGSVGMGRHMW